MEKELYFENQASVIGDVLEEVSDSELDMLYGAACSWWNVSCHLGNEGKWCTLTKECQSNCN